jgi:hypothetical protein
MKESREMRRRTIVSSLVLAGAAVAAPAGGTPPAGAQAVGTTAAFSGNFFGDSREEVFLYSDIEDPAPNDTMLAFDNAGTPGGPVTVTTYPQDVQGSFVPLAGDFDGDGLDEILWYGAGTAPDVLWDFTDFTTHTETPVSVRGFYVPVVGDFTGDHVDDILWYAPGSAADTLWEFDAGGTHTASSKPVQGNYFPLVASVGKDATDDILWYAAGNAPDTLWDWTAGTTARFTTQRWRVVGSYLPFTVDIYGDGPRGGDFFWYAPGPGTDTFWDYFQGQRVQSFLDPVRGFHVPVAGDFLGDGQEDILWVNDEAPVLWDHNGLLRHKYVLGPFATAIAARQAQGAAASATASGPAPAVAASGQESIAR